MAKTKYDTVVQAVRYDDDGRVLWVRAFQRLGSIWSDHVLLDRKTLVEQLNSGKKVVIGERIPFYGATFETSSQVKLVKKESQEIIISGDVQADVDCLQGIPII
jgi:hypothetical protein